MLNTVQNALPILEVVGIFVIILYVTGVLVALLIEALKTLITEERIKKHMSLTLFALIVNMVFALIVFAYVKVFVPFVLDGYELYQQLMILFGFLFFVFIASIKGYDFTIKKIKELLERKNPIPEPDKEISTQPDSQPLPGPNN